MGKSHTQDEWIAKAKAKHPGKYDYSMVNYVTGDTRVKIRCLTCGEVYEQAAKKHLSGSGCHKCWRKNVGKARLKSQDKWISEAQAKHPGKYDYSLVEYATSHDTVKIICLTCNTVFEQLAFSHIGGAGCPICGFASAANYRRKSKAEWLDGFEARHHGKYDYSLVESVFWKDKIEIICRTCGDTFLQSPVHHALGRGCQKCGFAAMGKTHKMTQDEWIAKAKAKHSGKYDYGLVEYVNVDKKVKIVCLKCNRIFEQTPTNHTQGTGCPWCIESSGEALVSSILQSLDVRFIREKRFPECKHKIPLAFDFYLPDHNVCIEYHGKQHYEPVEHWGGKSALKIAKMRDRIKVKYCLDNGIDLKVLPYWLDESQVVSTITGICFVQLALI